MTPITLTVPPVYRLGIGTAPQEKTVRVPPSCHIQLRTLALNAGTSTSGLVSTLVEFAVSAAERGDLVLVQAAEAGRE